MINLIGPVEFAYHLLDVADGATLVLRDASNVCVGRVHPDPHATDDRWAAELGLSES